MKFSLIEIYYDLWVKLLEFYKSFHARMLNKIDAPPNSHDWVGLYKNSEDAIPKWVACSGYFKE